MLFSVKLKNVAEDRRPHYWVSATVIFLIATNRSAHTTPQKLVKPVSKLMTNIMLGEKVKWAFGQSSLIKGISSGKAIIVMCAG